MYASPAMWGATATTRISPHFTLADLTKTSHKSLQRMPTGNELRNLKRTAKEALEPLWSVIGPFTVNSGYRTWEVNKAIGGSKKSDHPTGRGVDIQPQGMSNKEAATRIYHSGLDLDQVIWYEHKSHVHIGYRGKGKNRNQYLRAFRKADGSEGYEAWTPTARGISAVAEQVSRTPSQLPSALMTYSRCVPWWGWVAMGGTTLVILWGLLRIRRRRRRYG